MRFAIVGLVGILSWTEAGASLRPAAGSTERRLDPSKSSVVALSRSLLELEAGAPRKVRILHFGDSHLASELESGIVRELLAAAFGNGGPGLALPWTPPAIFGRGSLPSGSSPAWRRVVRERGDPPDDTGLAGCHLEAERAGAVAWIAGVGSNATIVWLRQPGGGAVEVLWDGRVIGRESLVSPSPEVATFTHREPGPDRLHRIEIRTVSGGRARLLGIRFESSGPGIVYTPLGVPGARIDQLERCRDGAFRRQLEIESPDLLIVSYGTNEANDRPFDPPRYVADATRALRRIQAAAPNAAILVTSPPDQGARKGRSAGASSPDVPVVRDALRRAAEATGALFFDLFQSMGGSGSVNRWSSATPPLVGADLVHFTSAGYARLARAVVNEIIGHHNRMKTSSSELRCGVGRAGALLAALDRPTRIPPETLAERRAAHPSMDGRAGAPGGRGAGNALLVFRDRGGGIVLTDDPARVRPGAKRVELSRDVSDGRPSPILGSSSGTEPPVSTARPE